MISELFKGVKAVILMSDLASTIKEVEKDLESLQTELVYLKTSLGSLQRDVRLLSEQVSSLGCAS